MTCDKAVNEDDEAEQAPALARGPGARGLTAATMIGLAASGRSVAAAPVHASAAARPAADSPAGFWSGRTAPR